MKKTLTTIILILISATLYSQTLCLSTEEIKYCYWNGVDLDDCESGTFPTLFKFIKKGVFTHRTSEITSTYYFDNIEVAKEDEEHLFSGEVTSDVGNKYFVLVGKDAVMFLNRKTKNMTVYFVKSRWEED